MDFHSTLLAGIGVLTVVLLIVRTNVMSKKAIYSWTHWHALAVLSLKYTPEGSFLLSGGHESVLVKWPHGAYGNQSQREFLPRLGAPVSHITSSEDNSVYVTSHLDNCKGISVWQCNTYIMSWNNHKTLTYSEIHNLLTHLVFELLLQQKCLQCLIKFAWFKTVNYVLFFD